MEQGYTYSLLFMIISFQRHHLIQNIVLILEKVWQRKEYEDVFAELKEIDPESAERIHPNNIRRVIRALEIFHCTGHTMSEQLKESANRNEV